MPPATTGVAAPGESAHTARRWTPQRVVLAAVAAAVVIFLVVKAADDLRQFTIVTLNGVTLAALYFVVASGFTLIFGLMRVVNMAHGSLYLLGGYLALKMQESWFTEDTGLSLSLGGTTDATYGLTGWFVPLLLATLIIGVVGVLMQQVFLRWNQGQDLRQALITIALSVIFADQMLAAFGGISKDIKTPTDWPGSVNLPGDVRFGFFRGVVVLGAALLIAASAGGGGDAVGIALCLGAGASYATYAVASKRLMVAGHASAAVMAVAFAGGAVLLLPVLVSRDVGWLADGRGVVIALHLGVVTTAVAYLLFGIGLGRIPVAVAATLSLAEPLTAALLGVLLLDERLRAPQWAGALLLLAGLALLTAPGRRLLST